MAKRGPKNPLSDDHKAAMAAGRRESRAVRDYLDALQANKRRPGRPRSPERMSERLKAIESELQGASPIDQLQLLQERRDLQAGLAAPDAAVDLSELEDNFVAVAKSYAAHKGISYATWREVGVPAAVLAKAGISRTS